MTISSSLLRHGLSVLMLCVISDSTSAAFVNKDRATFLTLAGGQNMHHDTLQENEARHVVAKGQGLEEEIGKNQQGVVKFQNREKSLASSYLVETSRSCGEEATDTWSLIPIEKTKKSPTGKDYENDINPMAGYNSWSALHSKEEQSTLASLVLKCERRGNKLVVRAIPFPEKEDDQELVKVLSRVMVQWVARDPSGAADQKQQKEFSVVLFPDSSHKQEMIVADPSSEASARTLFDISDESTEMVEMVGATGNALGIVPRKLVHIFNLLHRGIGLTVSPRNVASDFSELYVHRRTKSKRIFPNLYDMFVGGVSLAGEDPVLTAQREVAEELGLSRALGDPSLAPLFTCVVCTAYNRCVVTVFHYSMDTSTENIYWQEEEVAWGDFVPLSIIEAAADRSIQRLALRKEWPGSYPPSQSKWKGSVPVEQYKDEDWKTWDFVPDGLLVWEAWLRWWAESSS